MKKWLPLFIVLFIFLFLIIGNADAQCSQCKLLATHENSIDDKILDYKNGNNINTAILYIMMAPYVLIGIAALIFRKKIKKILKKSLLKN